MLEDRLPCDLRLMEFLEQVGILIYAKLNNINYDQTWMIAAIQNGVIPHPAMMAAQAKTLKGAVVHGHCFAFYTCMGSSGLSLLLCQCCTYLPPNFCSSFHVFI